MLQRYKLRLGDGTVLVVDHDGLNTWLMDNRAMVQGARSKQWHPLKDFLAEERILAKYAARQKANVRDNLPPTPANPREDEAARPVASPPTDRAESPLVSEPPSLQVAAGEPAVLSAETSERPAFHDEDRAPIVPKASDDEAPAGPAASALSDLGQPSIGALPSLLVLADDPAAQPPGQARPASVPYDDELPIIPLKPLDDRDEPSSPTAGGPGAGDDEQRAVFPETRRRGSLDVRLQWMASAGEALLAWWSDCLAALVRRLSPMFPNDPARGRAPSSSRSAAPEPRPSVSEPLRVQVLAEEPIPLTPLDDAPRPRARMKPPPTLSELPVLRFAETDEPDAGDVYEGESPLHAAWYWTKRVVVAIGLVAGGLLAAATWETWFPKAIGLGPMIFTEIDRYKGSRDAMEQQGRALQEATVQLPHLAPETIELVLSSSPTGVLAPAEVFRLASDAAARGVSALTPSESQELKALWRKLLDELTPAERELVREHDRALARRLTYPSEDRAALELFARGARALPSRRRERLQALSGKAVASGLALPAETAPRATAKR